ncbi:MAG: hypothetical protein HC822_21240 [Oscillochloris sp.]|nr:hypothetical protein [Oscillochloris sp.]
MVSVTITFSEIVSGVDVGDFSLSRDGGTNLLTGSESISSDDGGITWVLSDLNMLTDVDGSYTFTLTASGSGITDVNTNPLAGDAAVNWLADFTAPAVTVEQATGQADPAATAPIEFSVTFSEDVSGFTESDLVIGGTAGANSAVISGGPQIFSVSVSGMSSPGSVTLDIPADAAQDAAGNGNTTSTGSDNSVTFDPQNPIITGIVRADANPTLAATVAFSVTFSEDVSGVDVSDFGLSVNGVTGASIGSISGSGASYSVSVNTGSGSGSIRLDLSDDNSINDASGNPLGGAASGDGDFTAGESYSLDRTAPTALSLGGDPVSAGPSYDFTVVYSDNLALDVSSFGDGDVIVGGPNGFSQAATIVSIDDSTNGAPRTVTYRISGPNGAWNGAANGTYTVELQAGAVQDTLGNPVTTASIGDFTVEINEGMQIFLPLLFVPPSDTVVQEVDLTISRIEVRDGRIAVTIRNSGTIAINRGFWVDLYVNPDPIPSAVNQIWQSVGAYGAVWGVTGAALPLAPGEEYTLLSGDQFFQAATSRLPSSLAAGTAIYAQVDSANTGTSYGAVHEIDEQAGETYNNILGITLDSAMPLDQSVPAKIPAAPTGILPPRE